MVNRNRYSVDLNVVYQDLRVIKKEPKKMLNNEKLAYLLAKVAPYLRCIYHQPGRIRFKISLDILKKLETLNNAEKLEGFSLNPLSLLPGLKAYKFNPLTRSLTIEYDPNVIPYIFWDEIIFKEKCEIVLFLNRIVL